MNPVIDGKGFVGLEIKHSTKPADEAFVLRVVDRLDNDVLEIYIVTHVSVELDMREFQCAALADQDTGKLYEAAMILLEPGRYHLATRAEKDRTLVLPKKSSGGGTAE